MEQQLKFFEDMGSVSSIVVEDKNIRVMKRVPTTLEEKQQMRIQYAKLDLKLEAVFVFELLPAVQDVAAGDGQLVGEGAGGIAGGVTEQYDNELFNG
jgi:hypothetical protein